MLKRVIAFLVAVAIGCGVESRNGFNGEPENRVSSQSGGLAAGEVPEKIHVSPSWGAHESWGREHPPVTPGRGREYCHAKLDFSRFGLNCEAPVYLGHSHVLRAWQVPGHAVVMLSNHEIRVDGKRLFRADPQEQIDIAADGNDVYILVGGYVLWYRIASKAMISMGAVKIDAKYVWAASRMVMVGSDQGVFSIRFGSYHDRIQLASGKAIDKSPDGIVIRSDRAICLAQPFGIMGCVPDSPLYRGAWASKASYNVLDGQFLVGFDGFEKAIQWIPAGEFVDVGCFAWSRNFNGNFYFCAASDQGNAVVSVRAGMSSGDVRVAFYQGRPIIIRGESMYSVDHHGLLYRVRNFSGPIRAVVPAGDAVYVYWSDAQYPLLRSRCRCH